jgi:hypothetical protein
MGNRSIDSDRARAILDHPLARGQENLARHLALRSDLPLDQAIGALEAAMECQVRKKVDEIIRAGEPEGGQR